jgi:hypothetical protein
MSFLAIACEVMKTPSNKGRNSLFRCQQMGECSDSTSSTKTSTENRRVDLDALLTPEEFAARVGGGATARWAMDQARSGAVPAVKLGREWRFHPRTILERNSTALR